MLIPDPISDGPELNGRLVSSQSSEVFQTGAQRFERPVYDYPTRYAPCRGGCPAAHDIAWALFFTAHRRPDLALQAFKEESPFPAVTGRVCYHPCEPVCNRGGHDQPIAIHALERSFADLGRRPAEPVRPVYPQTVGVIGAGPAGLTAAYHLVHLGYPVTVYDANPEPGGVLAFGIPPYRLPRAVMCAEIDELRTLGVSFQCSVRVGHDVTWQELEARHHALFVATGLGRARPLQPAPPEDPRIRAGIDLLREVSIDAAPRLQGRVLVVGGGDVAIDVARSARRLGAEAVVLCALEERDRMPAHPDEVEAAVREGISLGNGRGVLGVEAEPAGLRARLGRVRRVERAGDGGVDFSLHEEGAEELPCAFLFYAVGQRGDLSFLPAPLGSRESLEVGPFGETGYPCLFAGGDIAGTYNVVNAIASAKRAVVGIDCLLRGWDPGAAEARIVIGPEKVLSMRAYRQWRSGHLETLVTTGVPYEEINADYFPRALRVALPELAPADAARRQSFAEVVSSYELEGMLEEAGRCFNCGICNMCGNCYRFCPDSAVIQRSDWSFEIDLEHCKGCGVCVEECPRAAMAMVPEREVVS